MMKKLNLIIIFVLISFQGLHSADELKLTHPNGGEVLQPRKMTTIKWEGPEISEGYKVEFSSDLGGNWAVLDSNIFGYEYRWLTPNRIPFGLIL